ncbi:hypothetical protein [Actinophytocola oryzae]|uniref:Uncharacterized protein n=1 Tax=Actinophytocola oryzae TaxID=502181 RepID=A0A4R7V583_9PSEU|nr:hypothetical protein [Actinophytocola oryzae]TDV43105.1 hypothetical protein CLV71_11639 [Actinophytocola oryzae]
MANEPSGLGPLGDVQVVAAMLRTDEADVRSFARVLTGALAEALPAGMVEVEYRRGFAGRLAGRDPRPVSVVVHGAEQDLSLRESDRSGVDTEVRHVVGGVVISRTRVDLDTWLWMLAETVMAAATRTAATQRAFERFMHGGA